MKKQSTKKTYDLRPRNKHISKQQDEQTNTTVHEIHQYWKTHEPTVSLIDYEKLVREGIRGWIDG